VGDGELLRNDFPHVLEQYEEVHGIGKGGDEIEFLVASAGLFVFRVDGECADAGDARGLERAPHGALQQCFTDTLAVPAPIHGKTR